MEGTPDKLQNLLLPLLSWLDCLIILHCLLFTSLTVLLFHICACFLTLKHIYKKGVIYCKILEYRADEVVCFREFGWIFLQDKYRG